MVEQSKFVEPNEIYRKLSTSSGPMQTIFFFFTPKEWIKMQIINKRFYEKIIPSMVGRISYDFAAINDSKLESLDYLPAGTTVSIGDRFPKKLSDYLILSQCEGHFISSATWHCQEGI